MKVSGDGADVSGVWIKYRGRWIKVSGCLKEVRERLNDISERAINVMDEKKEYHGSSVVFFGKLVFLDFAYLYIGNSLKMDDYEES